MKERTFKVVKEWTTKAGLKAIVIKIIWSDEVKAIAPSLHDYYVGYVEFDKSIDVISELDVHGGVTWGPSKMPDKDELYIGFDMNHLGDENIKNQEEYAINECEELAEQLI